MSLIEFWKQVLFINHSINDMLWYTNFDVNIHVCRNRNLIHFFMSHIESVVIANKARFIVEKKEIVKLLFVLSYNNVNDQLIDLSIFYMSNSSTNLLSISTLEKQDVYWNIENYIFKHQNKSIEYAFLQNNELYVFKLQSHQMIALSATSSLSFIVWHWNLDHMNFSLLRQYLKKLNHFYQNDCKNNHCDVCKLIKAKKKSNRKNNYHAKKAFHIIHIDLISITIENFENERYYINIIDDKSRWMKIYIVKNKHE